MRITRKINIYTATIGKRDSKEFAEVQAEVDGSTLVIYNIFVDESLRSKGIGKRLIKALMDYTNTTQVDPQMVMPGSEGFWNKIGADNI